MIGFVHGNVRAVQKLQSSDPELGMFKSMRTFVGLQEGGDNGRGCFRGEAIRELQRPPLNIPDSVLILTLLILIDRNRNCVGSFWSPLSLF